MTQLSEHFSLEEATRSEIALRKGLDNTPSEEVIETMKHTAQAMEQVRTVLGVPIHVSSWYRSLIVNSAVGGSRTSQHVKGEAVDFTAPAFGTPREICRAILDADIIFDQLIFEGSWVHVSFSDTPRHSVLTAHFSKGKVTYTQGIS